MKDKKEQMKRMGASEVLRGEEFRQYTMMLRNRGNVYKSKRAEVRSEAVLIRTVLFSAPCATLNLRVFVFPR